MKKSPIRLTIKSIYSSLSPKEQQIADFVLEHSQEVGHSSISDLSSRLNLADSTIFQFTRKLGYSGYKDFKVALLMQENDLAALSIHENIEAEDTEITMANKVFDSNIQTLMDTKSLLKEKDLKAAAELILEAGKTLFFGIGASDVVAMDACHKFLRSPFTVYHSSDYHVQLMQAAMLKKGDCAIIISHTGRTKEAIKIGEVAKKTGAKIIVITSHANSSLAKMGDVVFISVAEETEFRSEALSSRISQLSIIDSLFVICMFKKQEEAQETIQKVRRVISSIKQE